MERVDHGSWARGVLSTPHMQHAAVVWFEHSIRLYYESPVVHSTQILERFRKLTNYEQRTTIIAFLAEWTRVRDGRVCLGMQIWPRT